jgi:hypothetical protein
VRRILVLAGIVVALIVAFLAAWPRLVETSAIQEQLDRLLASAGGADLRIGGAVRLELLPQPRVTIDDATIGNRGGAGAWLAAERIEVELEPLGLLRARIEPRGLHLFRPRLDLAGADGAAWTGLAQALGKGELEGVLRVEVTDGAVVLADRAPDSLSRSADVIDVIAVRDGERGFRLDGSAILAGEPLRLRLTGDAPLGAMPLPLSFRLQSGPGDRPFTMEFDGQIAPGPAASGEVRLSTERGPPPAWLIGSLNLRGTLKGRLTADAERVALTDFMTSLPVGELRGAALFDLERGGAFDLALTSTTLTLTPELTDAVDRMMDVILGEPGPAGRIDLQIASLTWRGETLRRLHAEAELAPDGAVALRRLEAILPGQAALAWSGSAVPGAAEVVGEVSLQAAELRPLLLWLGVPEAGLPPGGLTTLDLAAEAVLGLDRLELRRLRARLDASELEGSATFTATPRPRLDLAVSVDRLNTALYAAPPAGWPDWQERLVAVDGSLNLVIASLTHDLLRASNVQVQATLDAGQLDLARLKVADLAGATLAVSGALDLPTGAWDATGTFATASVKPVLRLLRLPAPLEIDRLAPFRLEGKGRHEAGRTSLDLRLATNGARATLTGQFADPLETGTFALDLTAEADKAGTLLLALGWPVPTEREPLGPLALTARVERDAGPAAIAVDASIGDSRLVAKLDLDPAAAPPRLGGTVQVPLLDSVVLVAAYQTLALSLDAPPGNPLLWPGVWPRAPLNWAWLDRLQLDLVVEIDQLRHDGMELGAVTAHLLLDDGELNLEQLALPVAGGTLTGRVRLSGQGTHAALIADLRLAGALAQDLASAIAPGSTVQGVLDLAADAVGQGRSVAEVVGSLAGSGKLMLGDARLTGVTADLQPGVDQTIAELDDVAVRGPFTLSAGMLSSEPPGFLLTYPVGEATLGLRFDLLAWILDARLSAGPVTRRYLGAPGRIRPVVDP